MEIKNVYCIVNIVIIWPEKDHENSCDFPRLSLEMYALFVDQEISIKGIFQICIAFAETLHIYKV